MQVQVMIPVVVEDVNDLGSIERAIVAASRRLPSYVMQRMVDEVERIAISQDPGRLRKKNVEGRRLWTACGCAEFVRARFEDELEKKSYLLFDMRVNLGPRVQMTPAAQRLFGELAAISPSYDKTRRETELLWGDAPSTTTIWNCTQREGETIRMRADSGDRRAAEGFRRNRDRCDPGRPVEDEEQASQHLCRHGLRRKELQGHRQEEEG
jgi:hypothetical protein